MNKKINYLAIIPVYGTCIVLIILFIKTIRQEITRKKMIMYMFSCALVGFLSILISMLFLKFINDLTNHETFINTYGVWIGFILGGYIMNIFTFVLINKHHDELKK